MSRPSGEPVPSSCGGQPAVLIFSGHFAGWPFRANQLGFARRSLILLGLLHWALAGQAQPHPGATPDPGGRPSFEEWKGACAKLPSNRSLGDRMPARSLLPLHGFGEMAAALADFCKQCRTGLMAQTNSWVGTAPSAQFYDPESAYFLNPNASIAGFVKRFVPRAHLQESAPPFQPFAAKLRVPEGAEVFFHADFHGDIRSLLQDLNWLNTKGYLDGFQIAKPKFSLVFLGDYTDRGRFGVEVLYTLLRLKIANPDHVFLVRGNHEELSMGASYGFFSEGVFKYGAAFDVQKIERAYDFLPVVLYVGTDGNYIQCQHGGMEPGFDPRALLDFPSETAFQFLGDLTERRFLNEHPQWLNGWSGPSRGLAKNAFKDFRPEDPTSPTVLGFMWNDFEVFAEDPEFSIYPGRAYLYGPRATRFLLEAAQTDRSALRAVFRGHQQSPRPDPLMNRIVASHGVFRHWQEAESALRPGSSMEELAKTLDLAAVRAVPPNSVWTFNVSPDSVYGEGNNYSFDAFGILSTAKDFADWRLRVINVDVPP